jgi:IQ calmodulin-binding motif
MLQMQQGLLQSATIIQKHARGFLARKQLKELNHQGVKENQRSASNSPTHNPFVLSDEGTLAMSEDRKQQLVAEVRAAMLQTRSVHNRSPCRSGADCSFQVTERLKGRAKLRADRQQPGNLSSVLQQRLCNSRAVVGALCQANKAKVKCDHLIRTLHTRLELPMDGNDLDPERYSRPPQGSKREVRPQPAGLDRQLWCGHVVSRSSPLGGQQAMDCGTGARTSSTCAKHV